MPNQLLERVTDANVAQALFAHRQDRVSAAQAADFEELLIEAQQSRWPGAMITAAVSTDDLPSLFSDSLLRRLLGGWETYTPGWDGYSARATFNDFRNHKALSVSGVGGRLDKVKEGSPVKHKGLAVAETEYNLEVYANALAVTMQTLINDDLGALNEQPAVMGRGAALTEDWVVANQMVDEDGPLAAIWNAGDNTIVTGNPALSLDAVETGLEVLSQHTDEEGNPILLTRVYLVIPPQLKITADNIVNATQIERSSKSGSSNTRVVTANGLRSLVTVVVNPWLSTIATTNPNSWFLIADPAANRPVLEAARLRGFETPGLARKMPNTQPISGSTFWRDWDFGGEAWMVTHAFGATNIPAGKASTVASNGTG